jgi:hypothetical protein
MNEEYNNQTSVNPVPQSNNQAGNALPPPRQGGNGVIQPSVSIKQELQSSQQIQNQASRPVMSVPQSQQAISSTNPASVSPEATSPVYVQVGMSANQMGYNQPKSKLFDVNPKQLFIKAVMVLGILSGIFAALVFTNVVALSEFKNVGYTNSKGISFKLDFYSKHSSKKLSSGNKQLVSKVSKYGKFPVVLSISTTDETSAYNRTKDCTGFTKAFDVQNNNLNQKISVCNFGKQGSLSASGVYIAGFIHNNKLHIITISQDYWGANLSSQSGAQESLTRFGMEPYKADIERIVSSIKIE